MDTNLGMSRTRTLPGRFYPGQGRQFSGSPTPITLNRLYAIPFTALIRADALALAVQVEAAGAVGRLGLYKSDPVTGMPTTLIEDTGEFSLASTGEVIRSLSSPAFLDEPYWVVGLFGGTGAPQLGSCILTTADLHATFGSAIANGTPNVQAENAVAVDFAYDELPADFPTPALGICKFGMYIRAAQPAEE